MIKNVLPLALALLAASAASHAAVPHVATDIAPVHSLVAQVMGSLGEPKLVVSQGASPHGYSMRPSEARALQEADIVFWISPALTPWLAETIDTLSPDARHVEMLEIPGNTILQRRENALFEAHHHDEDHDDTHDADHGEEHNDAPKEASDESSNESHEKAHDEANNETNNEAHAETPTKAHKDNQHHDQHADSAHDERDPHAWLDPANALIWLDAIAEELSSVDPDNAAIYAANAESGKVEIQSAREEVASILAGAKGRSFIVFHDAYQYFENAFDFPASGAIALGDASKPGPARIQQIQDRVRQANVSCVLAEPQFNPGVVATVLDGTDAQSSEIDPLGFGLDSGPELYPALLRGLATALADCV